ncbi:hypothetical protein [Iodidimonas nitroreducens]|uniref:hypothetical protein n=1 Tax=Iodidimonas nitroreducens TaxID=1236968 RepID=UPI00123077CC|nr:hypothetical protein [Iodidimonas nitroreducens]
MVGIDLANQNPEVQMIEKGEWIDLFGFCRFQAVAFDPQHMSIHYLQIPFSGLALKYFLHEASGDQLPPSPLKIS